MSKSVFYVRIPTLYLASVAVRWILDRPQVAGAIVGISATSRLDEHRSILGLKLSHADQKLLEAALGELGSLPGEVYALEREQGGRHALIMKTNLNRSGG